jgi:hypothetical protein
MIVFIDESGDHNLSFTNLDNEYNVFILAAVCFRSKVDYEDFDNKYRAIKKELFGTDTFVVHTGEITRPLKAKDPRYLQFRNKEFRKIFFDCINSLIKESRFLIISRVIEKVGFAKKYGHPDLTPDPYNFSFDYVFNRIIFEANANDRVEIYPEERNTPENIRLLSMFERMRGLGTRFVSSREIKEKVKAFQLRNKNDNDSGIQLADLIVNPIGRHVIGKEPREGNEVLFSVVKEKLRHKTFEIFP